jgi:hypothetical protein
LLCQKKITTLGIENKPYLFILIKQFNFIWLFDSQVFKKELYWYGRI